MDIGPVKRVVKVEPEPFPLGHPENAPEEPGKRQFEPVPVEVEARGFTEKDIAPHE